MFFPITTQASISVIIIIVMANIVGVLVITVNIVFVLFVKYERPSGSKNYIIIGSKLSLRVSMVIVTKCSRSCKFVL